MFETLLCEEYLRCPFLRWCHFRHSYEHSKYSRKYAKHSEFYYFWSKWSNKFPKWKEKFVEKIKKQILLWFLWVDSFALCVLFMVKPNESIFIYMKNAVNICALCSRRGSHCAELCWQCGRLKKIYAFYFEWDPTTLTVPHSRKKSEFCFWRQKIYKFKDSFSTGTNDRNSKINICKACEKDAIKMPWNFVLTTFDTMCVFFLSLSSSSILFSFLASNIRVFLFSQTLNLSCCFLNEISIENKRYSKNK